MKSNFNYIQSCCTRGSFDFSCHKHGSLAMMLAFFPNWLDLLDRVMSNLLDGLLLGATSTTSRVAAPGVVSSTLPSNLDDNSVKAHTSRDIKNNYIQGNEYLFLHLNPVVRFLLSVLL
jgi:hypothetical protein